jgi:hypothetical protein
MSWYLIKPKDNLLTTVFLLYVRIENYIDREVFIKNSIQQGSKVQYERIPLGSVFVSVKSLSSFKD